MKVKGYIKSVNIDRESLDVSSFGERNKEFLACRSFATAEIVFTEGNIQGLIEIIGKNDPIELDVRNTNKVERTSKWRMLRLRDGDE
ncbi:hypothetical protein A2Z67_04755 [Candidatus Woesebacteria bacterium RBG_13_36_22]|uniref:Uncharacterized protein n=1 Tax=Candidatus Woesebacteria bacterium RBG_13_36_22 TaxID=1802478 RepID=A0A1F7X2A4_9BACT|nr:MAG: hypothetical protein A2Z67_04755 [Candidatus Woesebacteria bacterium RBG_13_36_22]